MKWSTIMAEQVLPENFMRFFSRDQLLTTCVFRDHDLEISYRIQAFASFKRLALLVLVASTALFVLFLVPDCAFLGDSAALLRISAIRLSAIPVLLAYYIIFGRLKSSRAYLRMINAMQLSFVVFYLLVLSNYSAMDFGIRCIELSVIIIIFFSFPNLWLNATLNGFALLASFTVFCICNAARFHAGGFFAQGIAYLVIAFLFCSASFYRLNYLKRSQYYNMNMMKKRINTDKLTGAFSRAKFDEDIKKQIAIADNSGKHFSVAIFDIDNFKHINDTYGHMEGDKVLTGIVEAVKTNKRPKDILIRWGGEEFIILFPATNISVAVKVTDRLRMVISSTIFSVGERITCSFGVTEYQHGDTPTTLLRRADKLMYDAKAAGKNYVVSSM
jgi:two-component system, cell cycle response regulator